MISELFKNNPEFKLPNFSEISVLKNDINTDKTLNNLKNKIKST